MNSQVNLSQAYRNRSLARDNQDMNPNPRYQSITFSQMNSLYGRSSSIDDNNSDIYNENPNIYNELYNTDFISRNHNHENEELDILTMLINSTKINKPLEEKKSVISKCKSFLMSESACCKSKLYKTSKPVIKIDKTPTAQIYSSKLLPKIKTLKSNTEQRLNKINTDKVNTNSEIIVKNIIGKVEIPTKFDYPSCIICITVIKKGEKSLLIPCGHMFHFKCVEKWFLNESKCPTCRFEIK